MSAVEGDRSGSILVVCTANICRSPLAEGLLRESLKGTGLTIRSAGIQPLVGHPVVPESVDYLRRRTGVILRHQGTPLTSQLVGGSGVILTMTERQRAEVVRFSPGALRRVFTLRQFVRLAPHLPKGSSFRGVDQLAEALARCRAVAGPAAEGEDDVIDPYGGTPEMYEYSFALIARSTSGTADVLRTRLACRDPESIPPSQ